MEEPQICGVCADFEPQAWRKSLCRNCFHSLDEHSEEMLAAEAEAAAKEKAEGKASSKDEEPKPKSEVGKKPADETKDSKPKTKITPSPHSKPSQVPPPVAVKSKIPPPSSSSSTTPSSSSPSSSSSSQASKASLKSSTLGTSKASPSPSTSAAPSISSSSSSTTTTTSSSSAPAPRTGKQSIPTPAPSTSKAKSLTSKFEGKTSEAKDSKSLVKTPSTTGQKSKATESGEFDKTVNADSKSSKQTSSLKSGSGNDAKKVVDDKTKKTETTNQKEQSETKGVKDSKVPTGRSKFAAPFGKDMLKSTKEALKKEKDKGSTEHTNSNESEHDATTKFDSLKRGSTAKDASIIDDKKKSATPQKSEGPEKMKTTTPSTENKTGSVNAVSKVAVGKSGQTKAQRVNGKIPDDHESSRSTREIDKTGTGKSSAGAGQGANNGTGVGEETQERQPLSDASGKDKKDDNLKQQQEKTGSAGERERKGATAAKSQVDAKGRLQNGLNDAAEPCAGKGPSGSDSVSQDVAGHKDNGADRRKVETQSATPTRKVVSTSTSTESLSAVSTIVTAATTQSSASVSSSRATSSHSKLSLSSLSSKSTVAAKSKTSDKNDQGDSELPVATSTLGRSDDKTSKKLSEELKKKEEKVATLENKLSRMEKRLKMLEQEQSLDNQVMPNEQKDEMGRSLQSLRDQLAQMEDQCAKLEKDNTSLQQSLQEQEKTVKLDQESRGKNDYNIILENDLMRTEEELDEVKDENSELKREIMEMKNEMDEMYDTFRENEHDEFRELQKELDMTAKNCRILQFKLRKAERRNEQIEEDRVHYEEKLRQLQDQFDSADAKNHIRILEEELRVAKEVSVRLHDELDIIEDKKNKALEDNKHLTELLEHTDKRQFRMEMEIDKLRDMVGDLRQQLKEEKSKGGNSSGKCNNNNNGEKNTTNNKDSSPERKLPAGSLMHQTSRDNQDYDVSQLMKDLCDTMERENDLKDQLKFTEEEAKMMRRRVSEMDEENENLRLQLKKMSEKASKHKKQEQKRVKELEEERKVSEAAKAALTRQQKAADVLVVVGAEDSDIMTGDEPIPVSERKDSTDEDLMNVMQLRVQLEMLEQELMTSHKKLDEMDLENENLHDEVKFLQERLEEKEKSQDSNLKPPEPSTPNAYYEDKIKELTQDVDDLRWKLIEKDREIERLTVVQSRHSRDHSHGKRSERLKKSKSLDNDNDPEVKDLRKQVEQLQMEIIRGKKQVEETEERNEELTRQVTELSNKPMLPQVEADGAAIENIELRDQVKRMDSELKEKSETIKLLTDDLQRLSRDTRTFQNIATSPITPGSAGILNIPPSWPESLGARAKTSAANQIEGSMSRDSATQLLALQEENLELRQQMAVLRLQEPRGVADGSSSHSTSSSRATATASLVEEIPSAGVYEPSPSVQVRPEKEKVDHEEGERSVQCSTAKTSSLHKVGHENNTKSTGGQPKIEKEDTIESGSSSSLLGYSDSESPEVIKAEDKTAKGILPSSSTSSDMATVTKNSNSNNTKIPDDGGGGENGQKETIGAEGVKSPRTRSEEDEKSILSKYPDSKSKVVVTGEEGRVELMEKILDMDDEIGELISCIRTREDEYSRMCREVKHMRAQMQELRDENRRNERDLLQELDMLHDKNTVMSNLLDIINERAEAAEEELERRIQEGTTASPPRSASNVSQVSALSDTSMGSDEVFLNAHGNKEGVITRDWEAKLKTRIESLERLLAEERQKVVTAEKKLTLSATEMVSPSISDDVKLRLREKELLQEELVESQRHLHIATDQIQGLRERLQIVEEEYHRLKMDYGKLYDEIDKPKDKEMERSKDGKREGTKGEDEEEAATASDSDKTPENSVDTEHPFLAKKISVIEAPKLNELSTPHKHTDAEVIDLKEELDQYKSKCQELEYKIEEINDIWRSKSAASDRDVNDFEAQLRDRVKENLLATETLQKLKQELCDKDKVIAENEIKLKEKCQELDRKSDTIKERENIIKKHEQDHQLFLTQVSQRDGSIRGLNDTIRVRDERLREKDDILFKLNSNIEELKSRLRELDQRNADLIAQMEEKDTVISRLRTQATSSSPPNPEATTCHTDVEKECASLKESHARVEEALGKSESERHKLEGILEQSRKAMDESMVLWKNEKATLQRDMNVLEEKVRMYEVYNTQDQGEAIESLKMEAHEYFREKETLKLQLESVEVKAEAEGRKQKNNVSRLQGELTEKLRLLKNEVEKNTRLAVENERLSVQAEKAYRYQQEERVLKAEHQAMKVRYETRFDKMYKECNKMVATIETLQREKDKDEEIIQTMQRNMTLIKDKYTDELLRAEDDKATLSKQMKEIDELRGHLDGLMKIVRELQDKSADQERLRTELINKMATDKASWEIERANLNSQVNQLEEQLSVASRQQNRAKDIQVNMGITWEKERKEQKRLLAEAHTLALDLQEQLRSRDEAFAHERKELLRQMEGDRLTWTKEKRETEKRMTQFESNARKLTSLQKRVIESQEALEKDSQQWRKDRKDLVDQLQQSKEVHSKDCKRIEDVLAGLVQLRELGSLLETRGRPNSKLDENLILHVKQAVNQINKAVEELSGPTSDGKRKFTRDSLETRCSSENLTPKTEEKHDDGEVIIKVSSICPTSEQPNASSKQPGTRQNVQTKVDQSAKSSKSAEPSTSKTTPKSVPKAATSNTIAAAIEKLQTTGSAKTTVPSKGKGAPSGYKSMVTSKEDKSTTVDANKPKLELDTNTWPRKIKAETQPLKSAPVTMRPFDFYSRRHERPPSYSSGTRSAQSSRATTPDITDPMSNSYEFTPSKKSSLPDPPPCFILPHHSGSTSPHRKSPSPSTSANNMTVKDKPQARRPVTFSKSLSVDSSDILVSDSPHRLASMGRPSNSAASTPTQDYTPLSSDQKIFPTPQPMSGCNLLSVDSKTASGTSRNKKYSPRTARKRFFAETPPTTPEDHDMLVWTERKSATTPQQPTPLPDPLELRREAEEEYVSLSSKQEGSDVPQSIKLSVSLDEKIHFHAINDPTLISSSTCSTPENPDVITKTTASPVVSSIPEDAILPPAITPNVIAAPSSTSAKEKRKFFKKSGSLDSTVGSSIAKMGVSAMPMAAPTGFTPSDFFAAVKGKLKPVFKHKSANAKAKEHEGRSPSPLFIPTEVPDISFGSSGSTLLPVPVPQVNFRDLEGEEEEGATSGRMSARSRHFNRGQGEHGKWRSKSADRAAPSQMHPTNNMGSSQEIWKFNETDL